MCFVHSVMSSVHQFSSRKIAAVINMKNKLFKMGVIGTIITALCCFTPVLVVLFGALGLAALVGYLDLVLFPLLGVFLILLVVGLFRYKRYAA